MGAVENEGDAVENGVIKFTLEQFETFFRKECPLLGQSLHFGIVIDVEMIGAENLPVKISVLNFIPAEIVKLRVKSAHSEKRKNAV